MAWPLECLSKVILVARQRLKGIRSIQEALVVLMYLRKRRFLIFMILIVAKWSHMRVVLVLGTAFTAALKPPLDAPEGQARGWITYLDRNGDVADSRAAAAERCSMSTRRLVGINMSRLVVIMFVLVLVLRSVKMLIRSIGRSGERYSLARC